MHSAFLNNERKIKVSNSTSVAAIHLPLKSKKNKVPNPLWISKINRSITNTVSKNPNLNLTSFNTSVFAANLALQCHSNLDLQYSIGGLNSVIQGTQIGNNAVLDIFFNSLAPILNMYCLQMGFNSINQMRQAVQSAQNINASMFIQGLSNALNSFNSPTKVDVIYKKYGEALDIDVVKSCYFTFDTPQASHTISGTITSMPVSGINTQNSVISPLNTVKMHLSGNINNENGDLVKSNYLVQKLSYCMSNGILVAVRIGKDVYEKCLIECAKSKILNAYNLQIDLIVSVPYYKGFSNLQSGTGLNVLNNVKLAI